MEYLKLNNVKYLCANVLYSCTCSAVLEFWCSRILFNPWSCKYSADDNNDDDIDDDDGSNDR
jgi:hypothetical protein